MSCKQQKIRSRRVSFQPYQLPEKDTEVDIIDRLEQTFRQYQIDLSNELPPELLEGEQYEGTTQKTNKSFKKEVNQSLAALQQLLEKQLSYTLKVILQEIFQDDGEEEDKSSGIKSLIIFYGLLKTTYMNQQNSNKVLRWIHDLIDISSLPLCMEISNIISSIMKKLIKLGFTILDKFMNIKCNEDGKQSDGQKFKSLVSRLIEDKKKIINENPYEICRVCQKYLPLNIISAHLKECERKHQIKYNQDKLEQKGTQILSLINKKDMTNDDNARQFQFFNRIFQTFNGKNVMLKVKTDEIKDILIQYEFAQLNQFKTVISLLKQYKNLISQDERGETLSDDESKMTFKSKRFVSIRGIQRSSTSLQHDSQASNHLSHSQKTINSESETHSRANGCRLADFQIIKKIGHGSYSQVFLVRKKNTRDIFAMKVIQFKDFNLQRIEAFKKQQKIYKSINGGFNIKLYYSFREQNLYFFILDYGAGGNFKNLLQNQVYIQQKYAKVYLANLILAVNSIHQMGIVHRDLKPDNIVIGQDGQLILTDFNLSKLIKEQQNVKQNTFYGTPDYIAPQVLKGQIVNETIDWFSLGVIAYEMIIGITPFSGYSQQEVFQNILKGQIEWPEIGTQEDQISFQCKDLISKMLDPQPVNRLGSFGIAQFKNHPFFQGINWQKLSQNQFLYIPEKKEDYQQDRQLLKYIQGKKKKMSVELQINGESIIRYDILKQATNQKVRSHRNSRFKLQKELQMLKMLPSMPGLTIFSQKKQNSQNNFNSYLEDIKGQSCRQFLEDATKQASFQ